MKRVFRVLIAMLLVSSLLLSLGVGCGSDSKESEETTAVSTSQESQAQETTTVKPDPFEKMPELVEFTTGQAVPADGKMPEGESYENNDVAKWFAENVNVKAKMIWSTSDQNYAYEQKINLLIAANDIPDVLEILVEPHGINILSKLVKNDMIEDLTSTYENYASPTIKDFMEKANNEPLKNVTFDGKLMAIPGVADTETAIPVIWTRQDWLDKVGLTKPTTLEEVANVIKTFQKELKAAPLSAQQNLYKDDSETFDFVFNALQAYPGDWIKDKDGKIVYGSIQPEVKEALNILQQWYKEGLIDKEFMLKDKDKAFEVIKKNTGGIFMGAWWSHWWPLQDSLKNDPKAQWTASILKSSDGIAHARSYPIIRNFVVVRKGFEHPEAIMKCINHNEEASLKKYDWYNKLRFAEGAKYGPTTANLAPVSFGISKYADEISRRYSAVMDVVNGKVAATDADAETQSIAGAINTFKQAADPVADLGIYANAQQWLVGAHAFTEAKVEQKFPAFFGTTDLLQKKKATLDDLEKKAFLEIITGKSTVDEFDKFVESWKSLGGEEVTNEINNLGR